MARPHTLPEDIDAPLEAALEALCANPFGPKRHESLWGAAPISAPAQRHLESVESLVKLLKAQDYKGKAREMICWSHALLIYAQLTWTEQEAQAWQREALIALRLNGISTKDELGWLTRFDQWRRASQQLSQTARFGVGPSAQQWRARLWELCLGPTRSPLSTLHDGLEQLNIWLITPPGQAPALSAQIIAQCQRRPFDEQTQSFPQPPHPTLLSLAIAGLTPQEQEAALFGYRKGAINQGPKSQAGALELLKPDQTLLITGLETTTAQLQRKLLIAARERAYSPQGSQKLIPLKGRLILSLEREPADLIDQGVLLPQVYYGLAQLQLEPPSLSALINDSEETLESLIAHELEHTIGVSADRASALALRLRQCCPPRYAWPGDLEELRAALWQLILHDHYRPLQTTLRSAGADQLAVELARGEISIKELTERYCLMLYEQQGTYEAVAARTGLDRRTVKKYIHPNG